jgi:hypothetical protein
MKLLKNCIIALISLLTTANFLFAQEKFDIVSFKTPAGWQKEMKADAVQFTIQDKAKGTFALMMLLKSFDSTSDESRLNFNSSWTTLVENQLSKTTEAQMQPAATENGWNIESGLTQYEDKGTKGVAMLISATGGKKVVNLLLLTNTDIYQSQITGFIGSIVLPKLGTQKTPPISQSSRSNSAPIVGLWSSYVNEMNGAQTTGGYFRKEYKFNGDDTYTFLEKNFASYNTAIVFKHETGSWSVSGNKLTVTPTKGRIETWSKSASGRNNEWGKLLKTESGKLEKVTYTFEMKYLSGMEKDYLVLSYCTPTERDGRQNNSGNQIWQYSSEASGKALIDMPPK